MENKINVAELLKNCPTGMELDCLTFDNVFFQELDWSTVFPIICYRINNGIKENMHLTEFGSHFSDNDAKCVIFPKGKTTWEGFQRPFKDGDIVFTRTSKYDWVSIFKQFSGNTYHTYVDLHIYSNDLFTNTSILCDIEEINTQRLATKEEKAKLFQAIKDNGYVWNEETKSLEKLPKIKVNDRVKKKGIDDVDAVKMAKIIRSMHTFTNKFDINTLTPFKSEVLVRDYDDGMWMPTFWGKYIENSIYSYLTTRGGYKQCIPYEGNEHLLGTTNDCDEYFKNW